MNKEGHIISSFLILIVIMGSYLAYLLWELGAIRVLASLFFSVVFFMVGCTLPDIDHPKVHGKIFFLRWLGKVTKHRGHFHSLVASAVYGLMIFVFVMIFNFFYWVYPIIFGIGGFVSHLIEDDLNRYKLKSKPTRGLKIL